MREIDVKPPRQARRAAEQLLVEVVADAADRLRDEQAGRRRVEVVAVGAARRGGGGAGRAGAKEGGSAGAARVQPQGAGGVPRRDSTPDPEPALPDSERPPPRVRRLVPACDEEVEPAAD